MRVCAEPDCPAIQQQTRCATHRTQREVQRGTRQQRGYDATYDALHREYQRRMDAGETFDCWDCRERGWKTHDVDPSPGAWHLGHDRNDRSVIRGPQCARSNLTPH